MILPILLSVPHAGLKIPPEVRNLCALTESDILKDADEGAEEIYLPLQNNVSALVTTDIARTFLDMNRYEHDRKKDGIVKTHTSWDVPVYREFPSEDVIKAMIETYYRPYHADLTFYADGAKLGVDCHTMSATGPPVGPDPGKERPLICMSNADFTCSHEWIASLAECFKKVFHTDVSINQPFRGGYIIRSHAEELPWVQLELSRASFFTNKEKGSFVLEALSDWCKRVL